MKITRKIRMTVKTVHQSSERQPFEKIFCEQCAEFMMSAQMSADSFGFSSRAIFRLIEAGAIHFVETDRNEIYVCLLSVKEAFQALASSEPRKIFRFR